MSVAGSYECVTKTPMGDQKSVLTVNVSGDSWTGTNAGAQGSLDVYDGKVDGNTLTWKMNMTVPMPMTLEGTATVDGDTISGSVTIPGISSPAPGADAAPLPVAGRGAAWRSSSCGRCGPWRCRGVVWCPWEER